LRGRLQGLAEGVFHPDESQFRSLLAQVEGLSRLIEDLRVLSLSDNARLDVRRARTDVVAEV
ncbi:MAG TPA: two-component sensor histidine kinase, partial [Stenotrophomonas sp.]|nr:two-component sensor histidine kinase [Stenotrophomonas sp.]